MIEATLIDPIIMDCLYDSHETPDNAVKVEFFPFASFGFHPLRLEANRDKLTDLVSQLPDRLEVFDVASDERACFALACAAIGLRLAKQEGILHLRKC